jgi:hypothetical protein
LTICDNQPIFTACSSAQTSVTGTAATTLNLINSNNIGRQLLIGAKYNLRDNYFSVSR